MTYKHLTKWTKPDHYAGAAWPDWYPFLGRSRGSSTLEQSNFESGLAALGGESETVVVIRERHWAVGWIEWIGIHESDTAALQTADGILAALEEYPVVDETHWGELEYDRAANYWRQASIADRIYWIRRSCCGASMFAARRDYLPEDDVGELVSMLAE